MDAKVLGNLLALNVPGVIILDFDHRVLWSSDFVKTTFDTVGKTFREYFQFDVDLRKKGYSKHKTSNGDVYVIHIVPIENSDSCSTVILMEQENNFENLKTKLLCYETIFEKINDGIMISDHNGRIVAYNAAQELLEEKTAVEMVGKYLWDAYQYYDKKQSEHLHVYESGHPVINKYRAHAYAHGVPKYVSYSTYPLIVDGVKIGAYSVSKNETKLHTLLEETIQLKRMTLSSPSLKNEQHEVFSNGTQYTFSDIIGNGKSTKQSIREAQTMAWLDNNLLIVGETGTGKEVYAQSIHNYGKKTAEPFIGINCAAIPETLLEGILFGTTKGAFTGAVDRAGLFEEAREGTIFLDELNSMPISMQSKLLRVLQERSVNRVGGFNLIPFKCRVICAMNEDPQDSIANNRLRQDLFFRVAGLSLYLEPLRNRKEEIMTLSDYFIQKYNLMINRSIAGLDSKLENALKNYDWPGNIRELEHVIENLMVRALEEDTLLTLDHLPTHLSSIIINTAKTTTTISTELLNQALHRVEKKMIIEALNRSHGNLTAASRELGIIRQSLIYRMKKLGMERPIFNDE